jgi:imidazole glycerol-phosphate synthase subunit HisF
MDTVGAKAPDLHRLQGRTNVIRIIPRLDIKSSNLVKGIHLEGLRVLGKPEDFARYYFENGADELFYMDAVASLYGRNSLLDIVERTSREVFIPLCVGGGLRSVDDIRAALRAGADKVALNTAAIRRPELISEAAEAFGASTIVIAIEAIRQSSGRYECFTDCGREHTDVDALEWAVRAEKLGAGELVVTSVDREGTGGGFDIELVRGIADAVSIPVIAHGGAGSVDHVVEVADAGRADAVCVASMLHYEYLDHHREAVDCDKLSAGNTEFLRRGKSSFRKTGKASLTELKSALKRAGLDCREEYETAGSA